MIVPRPVMLIIMDGWGCREETAGNAIFHAHKPNIESLKRRFPWTRLMASGEFVGLPEGQMGNSEVGHLNIGSGRIVYQDLLRISRSIARGEFYNNEVLCGAVHRAARSGGKLHLLGLLSDGGVHSHIEHLFALLELARREGLNKVCVHPILDGRDVPPANARVYIEALEGRIKELGIGEIVSIAGRYYTMDRDRRWDRIEKSYRAYVYGEGIRACTAVEGLEKAYSRGETDEFVQPTVITPNGSLGGLVESRDAVIFFNFRPDRARQITRTFTEKNFLEFDRGPEPPFPYFVCMTEYDRRFNLPVAYPPEYIGQTLGEVLASEERKQLRIAETEKYAHVTFFFNGGKEEPFPGEKRCLIPSPEVETYDLQPEMSALEVTDKVIEEIKKGIYDFIVLNFANPDMVGHTGKFEAAVKAVETVDRCIGDIVPPVLNRGGAVLVTGDHGNAEQMYDMDGGEPHTAHTSNAVPFILVYPALRSIFLRRGGILADIAPTVLDIMNLTVPEDMTGRSLIPPGAKSIIRR